MTRIRKTAKTEAKQLTVPKTAPVKIRGISADIIRILGDSGPMTVGQVQQAYQERFPDTTRSRNELAKRMSELASLKAVAWTGRVTCPVTGRKAAQYRMVNLPGMELDDKSLSERLGRAIARGYAEADKGNPLPVDEMLSDVLREIWIPQIDTEVGAFEVEADPAAGALDDIKARWELAKRRQDELRAGVAGDAEKALQAMSGVTWLINLLLWVSNRRLLPRKVRLKATATGHSLAAIELFIHRVHKAYVSAPEMPDSTWRDEK